MPHGLVSGLCCARPGCAVTFQEDPARRGRKRQFHSARCRRLAARALRVLPETRRTQYVGELRERLEAQTLQRLGVKAA